MEFYLLGSLSGANTTIIHVRLLDEPVPVWRPVQAQKLESGYFVILPQQLPDYEVWEFMPGEMVAAEVHTAESGEYLRATASS